LSETEQKIIRATLRGLSRAIILWLTSKKPMSGYSIVKEMSRITGQKIGPGIIYPQLYELETSGLLIGKWSRKGKRRTKYYTSTEEGVKVLNRLREHFQKPLKDVLREFLEGSFKE